ncbi:malate synthase A [Waddlia chondrophila]|uniref:Malate synthase n=1 Tax=Waddlia chondrophila (strain ATCC VR-1470 / WSU 86-1044) TaxID=716544 RepID=D6YVC4_WADCW|nr:malate synthase A [Waddlia chondrophila]ADI38085.1 Malate synthase [Waddlia chondrophila WSU 86-1044]
MQNQKVQGIEILGKMSSEYGEILTDEALSFIGVLHRRFNQRRLDLLEQRAERQQRLNRGELPMFLKETEALRNDIGWTVAETPDDLQKRWVEITGPTDRKMVINAMNSGADAFMADFEDANSPTWDNLVQGQINLRDAIDGSISFENPDGKTYALNETHATLLVRPRGWHLNEKHCRVDEEEVSGSLFDFGLYFFHNAHRLLRKGSGPYFYLPKLESHLEARLWNDVFLAAQEALEIPRGTIRATVLIETILAAFEMEEILFELREHSAGLNAGRWDYIFSVIKKFRRLPGFSLPDRNQITMTVPFMRAYTELLVKTCHQRGAHAIGGMAAFIPNRKDPEVTEKALRKVKEDKLREVGDGCDGTWVAHPDLVPVARAVFEENLEDKANQKDRLREDVHVAAEDLLHFSIPNGTITEEGVRHNINVALQYLASWLSGKGAAAIDNLMEDAATAEISRAQVWQWIHAGLKTVDGKAVTDEWVSILIEDELAKIRAFYGELYQEKLFTQARALFEELVFSKHFVEFLTLPAYQKLR